MTFDELKEKAHSLPLQPGVYLMSDKTNTVIYVGKAKALKNRVSQYFQEASGQTEKTRAMVAQIDHFDVIVADSEFEALILECSLIKRHKPRYNILLKDDKGYPYIRLSVQDAYPTFSLAGRVSEDGARYFGPYGGRHDSQEIIDALRTALKLPSCSRKFPRDIGKERPCLNYHMGQCDGYCREEMTLEQHREAIAQAIRLLEGKFGEVEKDLTARMLQAAEQLEFEKAAALRDRMQAIELLGKRQKVVSGRLADTDVIGLYQGEVRSAVSVLHYRDGDLTDKETELLNAAQETGTDILSAFVTQYYTARGATPRQILLPLELEDAPALTRMLSEQSGHRVDLTTPQRGAKMDLIRLAETNAREECEQATTREERTSRLLAALAELLKLPAPPERIEAYDISNTGGDNIVASMTVFAHTRPKRSDFRKFRVKGLRGPDDYASMEQVLTRRFRRDAAGDEKFGTRPDLLLLDGGANHAAIGERVLRSFGLEVPVFGMVKDDRHRTRALVTAGGEEIGIQAIPALFAFIGQIQEETHRYAIEFHRSRRSKTAYRSVLEQIPGVGEARRKQLLKQFKSIKAIRSATREQLGEVLPNAAARAVYEHFHPPDRKGE